MATNGEQRPPLKLAEPPRKKYLYAYKPELDAEIREHFTKLPWQRGAGSSLFVFLTRTKPDLLVDARGTPITPDTFSAHCAAVLARDSKSQPRPDAREMAATRTRAELAEREAAVARAQRAAYSECVDLAGTIMSRTWELVREADAETLRAMAALVKVGS